jgi:Flp pilus assembly protein TadG
MGLRKSEEGSSLIELAVLLPVLLLISFSIFDYAFWLQKAIRLQEAAEAGAAYGAIPGNATDTAGMTQAANFSATGSRSGTSGFVATPTTFYTCSPGGTQVTLQTSCSGRVPFHYVQVTTSMTSTATVGYSLLPSSVKLTGRASLRVEAQP